MDIAKLRALLAAGLFAGAFAPALAAPAASPMTAGFLANLDANVAFLDRSSHLVSGHTDAAGLRAYAADQVQEATQLASRLDDLRPAMVAEADLLRTGRSVAVAGAPAEKPAQAANGRTPPDAADLARLAKLSGRAFDDLYWEKQLDALSQIEADYRTYIAHGDDPVLVALARGELPKIMRRLTALTKI